MGCKFSVKKYFYAPFVRNSVPPSADVPKLFGAQGRGRTEAPSLSVIFCVSAPATRPTGLRGRVLRLKSCPPRSAAFPLHLSSCCAFRRLFLWIAFREGNLVRGRYGRGDYSCTMSASFSGPLQMDAIDTISVFCECVQIQGLPLIARQRRSSLQGCQSLW